MPEQTAPEGEAVMVAAGVTVPDTVMVTVFEVPVPQELTAL